MHEPFDSVEDLDERPERDHLCDGALELVADVVSVDDPLPRILLGLLEPQRNALPVTVDVEHLDRDRIPDRQDLARMVDMGPRELRDVDQSVDPIEIDERPEVDNVGDLALDDLTGLETVEDPLAVLLALLLEHRASRQHHVVARAVELDDLGLNLLAHVLIEIRHAADVDERSGQEAPDAEVDDQTALDDLDHLALDRLT